MNNITTILFDVGGTLITDDMTGIFRRAPKLRSDALEVLFLLKEKYELHLATRYPLPLQEKILKDYQLEKIFKLIKETPPFIKPDYRFFIWLLDKIKIKPEAALMIGDQIEIDIIPAKSVGLKTMWLYQGDVNSFSLPQKAMPDWHVKTFKEIAEILL